MVDEEAIRSEQNLKVIREYLARCFVGFKVTEDNQHKRLCHAFTLSNRNTGEEFRLKVAWARLSEVSNTPDRTTHSLEHGGVAGKMRQANGDYFVGEFGCRDQARKN